MLARLRGLPPEAALAWMAAALAPLFGVLAVVLGQDANWDLRNYHFYNPYAFLNGRLGFDIAPAQPATFYNPLMHVPFYLLAEALPPRAVGFVLGTIQGLNLVPLSLIAHRVLALPPGRASQGAALSLSVFALSGAGFLSELGASFFDNVLSLLVLGALALLLNSGGGPLAPLWRSFFAGVAGGLAVGFKPTMAIYALGLGAATLAQTARWLVRFVAISAYGLGGLLGLALGGGYWMGVLMRLYGNPIFPHLNHVFRSPMAPLTAQRDIAFVPDTWGRVFTLPFRWAADSKVVGEIAFRDLRLTMVYAAVIAAALIFVFSWWRRDLRAPALTRREPARMILLMAAVVYAAWVSVFGIYRYLIGLELLAPLLLVAVVDRMPFTRYWRLVTIVTAFVAIVVTLRPGDWGRVAWAAEGDYVGVRVPPIERLESSLVLMSGFQPFSYVIPRFPPATRFLRVQSYFSWPTEEANGHNPLMRGIIANHQGPLLALFHDYEQGLAVEVLSLFGLGLAPAPCARVPTRFEQSLVLCPVRRLLLASAPIALAGAWGYQLRGNETDLTPLP
jgi:hypothetical protein